MIVYLTAITLSFLFAAVYVRYRQQLQLSAGFQRNSRLKFYNKKITPSHLKLLALFVLSVFPVWFITAFRYDVGTDYFYTYVPRFELSLNGQDPFNEFIFNLLYRILVVLGLDVVWVFIITGAVIVGGIYRFCFKYSKIPLLSIALFFAAGIYFSSLNNVRQYVAMVIGLFGMYQTKNLKAFALFIISGLTHVSGFAYIPLFLFLKISKLNFSRTKYFVCAAIGFVASYVIFIVLKQFLLTTRYAYFFDSFIDNKFSMSDLIVNFVLFVLSVFYFDNRDEEYKKLAIISAISVTVCFVGIFLRSMELTGRILRIFTIFQLTQVPVLILKDRNVIMRNIYCILFVLLFGVLTFNAIVLNGTHEVLPYRFVFGINPLTKI